MRTWFAPLLLAWLAGCSVDNVDRVDQLFAAYDSEGMPGAAVMVIHDGEAILDRKYGLANVEEGIPVQPGTNFRLASVTKQFTATAVLMLVEEGKLSLDDSIRRYFPEFPEFADEITIRHLLQHNSGLEDYEPIYGDPFPEQILDRGVVEIIAFTEGHLFSARQRIPLQQFGLRHSRCAGREPVGYVVPCVPGRTHFSHRSA